MTIHFEDLAVGDAYETGEYTVTKEEIVEFAEQFDPQPFHVDEAAAADSMFGGLVASGLHTLCLSVRLFITDFVQGEEGLANMGGLGMNDLRWHAPVRPNDTIHVRFEVTDKTPSESRENRGYVDFHRRVFVDDTEVLSVVSHNVVRRKDAPRTG